MELYRRLLEATQALLEKASQIKPREKEIIQLEENPTHEEGSNRQSLGAPRKEKSSRESPQEPRKYPTSDVLEVEDGVVNKLWEELKQGKLEEQKDKQPPLEEIDFDQNTLVLELRSELVDVESEKIEESTKGTLRKLLSFQGEYEAKS